MPLSARFESALGYAAQLHAPQKRKGADIPYVAHLLAVTSIALEFGADEDEAIAALLHDAIEDGPENTRRTPADIKADILYRYGSKVLAVVQGCTDAEPLPGQKKPAWQDRKQAYIEHLQHADASARFVSACDKLHNARSILLDYLTHGETVFDRFTGKRDGTLWYYQALVETFQRTDDGSRAGYTHLTAALARTVQALMSEVRA
ncbi:HD domain-containing protein [Deinococcus peraridilitoris]|uniref:HD/PDEase domain-containing protein n=1 Tax=Deinococcus peraridilitoris (strain DSM 19664 / LMG 22246 / CIP 109416 / KR-200) TaxID=937777 RepID=L0A1B4_DEIPD|nr:HD domain-containing protein [Deinococcus peraridilitoris]AFZ67244.1 hypothetical protein Deipe_1723 [Deinococcus peraridilitoris DSM 19664]